MLEYILLHKEDMKAADIEASAILAYDFISNKERIISTGIEAVYKLL